jgi:DNA-binding response OmpR family regulator
MATLHFRVDQLPEVSVATILLIEDQPRVRRSLARELRRCGHQVREAPHGGEVAMAEFDAGVDVVVTDIFMPEKDGLDVLREIRQRRPETPVIAISGGWHSFTSSQALDWARTLGADGTLDKPVTAEELNAEIRRVQRASDGPQQHPNREG